MKSLCTLLMLLAAPMLAFAQDDTQTVWRCGADGRSYSAVPCAEGRALTVAGARPAHEVQAAQAIADRERQLADRLQSERAQRDSVAPGTGLIGIYDRKAKLQSALDLRPPLGQKRSKNRPKNRHPHLATQPAGDGTFRATAPVSRQKRG
jgi:hypothetical protein